jgi:hypothetical protein
MPISARAPLFLSDTDHYERGALDLHANSRHQRSSTNAQALISSALAHCRITRRVSDRLCKQEVTGSIPVGSM